jgi:hypothetical protein
MLRPTSIAILTCAALSSCNDAETAQISRGGNEIGPATTEAVNERAAPIPAVTNVQETGAVPPTVDERMQVQKR